MKRLSEISTTKKEQGKAVLKVNANDQLKFVNIAMIKLGLNKGDFIDLISENDQFYVAKVNEGGFKLSATGTFNSITVNQLLRNVGTLFEITEETINFEGINWNRLQVIEVKKQENEEEVKQEDLVKENF